MEAAFALTGVMIMVFMMIAFGIFYFSIFALLLAGMVLWVIMLVDCIQRPFPTENDKITWILVLCFTGIIGGVIYYFMVKRPDQKQKGLGAQKSS